MRKLLIRHFVLPTLLLLLTSSPLLAQRRLGIEEFDATIQVRGDGSIRVMESIQVHFEKAIGNGRLFPTGLARILLGKRKLRTGRIFALGIKSEYRTLSIFPTFSLRDPSWILEDNVAINAALVKMGVEVYRRWRIYEKPLTWVE